MYQIKLDRNLTTTLFVWLTVLWVNDFVVYKFNYPTQQAWLDNRSAFRGRALRRAKWRENLQENNLKSTHRRSSRDFIAQTKKTIHPSGVN